MRRGIDYIDTDVCPACGVIRYVELGSGRPDTGFPHTAGCRVPGVIASKRFYLADDVPLPREHLVVAGYCPMGCGETLFLGEGGHVTCSWHDCPDPVRADGVLRDPRPEREKPLSHHLRAAREEVTKIQAMAGQGLVTNEGARALSSIVQYLEQEAKR